MQKQLQAEAHVLDRVMYLLEEGSVQRLMSADDHFADYVQNLYATLTVKSHKLLSA